MNLDHIGIAVRNLAESVRAYAALVGADPAAVHTTEVPQEKVRIAELRLGGVEIELMEPLAEDSPISGFLDKRGEGIHHLCYRVEDAEALFTSLRANGVRTLSDEVRRVRGYAYFFVHPKDACGVLTEFKQPLEPSNDG
jgi:methylmalonyl-CoA/ethylmalonyl-CoA epimerase